MRRIPLWEASALALCLLTPAAAQGLGLPPHTASDYGRRLVGEITDDDERVQPTSVAASSSNASDPQRGLETRRVRNGARNFMGHHFEDEALLDETDGEPGVATTASRDRADDPFDGDLIDVHSTSGFRDVEPEAYGQPEESSWLDHVQMVGEGVGAADPTGVVDLANGVVYLFRGRWTDAGISFLGIIPYIGDTAKVAKYGVRGANALRGGTRLWDGARVLTKGCFLAGVFVETVDGRKAVEDVRVGDQVLARDEATGQQGYKPVEVLFRGHTERVVTLRIGGAPPLRCTPEHPFWVIGRGWVEASELAVGALLRGTAGEALPVSEHSVRAESADHYNFQVGDWHTYFVAADATSPSAWVHNTCFTVTSAIKRDPLLVRAAERAGRSVQRSLDNLVEQLSKGNLNPGIGTKGVFGDVVEARARDGARVYYRVDKATNTVEIVGKSNKNNQRQVIKRLREIYGD